MLTVCYLTRAGSLCTSLIMKTQYFAQHTPGLSSCGIGEHKNCRLIVKANRNTKAERLHFTSLDAIIFAETSCPGWDMIGYYSIDPGSSSAIL